MNWSVGEETGADAPPWEPLGRFGEGHGYPDSVTAGRALARQAPLYRRRSADAIAAKSGLTRRGVIYEYIRGHPGTHVRGMANDLGLATGDVHYHLFWLEKHGFVKTKKTGFYRLVFPTMAFREEQEALLGALSMETPREMILCLLLDAAITQSRLASSLGLSQPTVSWHMYRLIQLGLVSKSRSSRGISYEVVAERSDVLAFVKSYHPDVWKRWARRLSDLAASAEVERAQEGSLQRARPMPPAVVELIGKS